MAIMGRRLRDRWMAPKPALATALLSLGGLGEFVDVFEKNDI